MTEDEEMTRGLVVASLAAMFVPSPSPAQTDLVSAWRDIGGGTWVADNGPSVLATAKEHGDFVLTMEFQTLTADTPGARRPPGAGAYGPDRVSGT